MYFRKRSSGAGKEKGKKKEKMKKPKNRWSMSWEQVRRATDAANMDYSNSYTKHT
jgi:hypothetical protein